MAQKLTVTRIATLSKPAARREIPDGRVAGLYLVCQPSGVKSWALRYRVAGKPCKLTIGPYPGITLARARELAQQAMGLVAEGRDPHGEKVQAKRSTGRDRPHDWRAGWNRYTATHMALARAEEAAV